MVGYSSPIEDDVCLLNAPLSPSRPLCPLKVAKILELKDHQLTRESSFSFKVLLKQSNLVEHGYLPGVRHPLGLFPRHPKDAQHNLWILSFIVVTTKVITTIAKIII